MSKENKFDINQFIFKDNSDEAKRIRYDESGMKQVEKAVKESFRNIHSDVKITDIDKEVGSLDLDISINIPSLIIDGYNLSSDDKEVAEKIWEESLIKDTKSALISDKKIKYDIKGMVHDIASGAATRTGIPERLLFGSHAVEEGERDHGDENKGEISVNERSLNSRLWSGIDKVEINVDLLNAEEINKGVEHVSLKCRRIESKIGKVSVNVSLEEEPEGMDKKHTYEEVRRAMDKENISPKFEVPIEGFNDEPSILRRAKDTAIIYELNLFIKESGVNITLEEFAKIGGCDFIFNIKEFDMEVDIEALAHKIHNEFRDIFTPRRRLFIKYNQRTFEITKNSGSLILLADESNRLSIPEAVKNIADNQTQEDTLQYASDLLAITQKELSESKEIIKDLKRDAKILIGQFSGLNMICFRLKEKLKRYEDKNEKG